MKNKIAIIIIVIVSLSCAKKPKDINYTDIFDISINNIDISSAKIEADNSKRYQVLIKTKDDVQVDDNKQVTVSISDGFVSSSANIPSTSSQASLTMQGGQTVFYLAPGRKAQPNGVISLSIGGATQFFKYSILPSEPNKIKITAAPSTPTVVATVTLTAFLLKDSLNSYSSDNLMVSFEVIPKAPVSNDTIIPSLGQPPFSYSGFDGTSGFVIAKSSFFTNQKKGNVIAVAKYQRSDMTIITDTVKIKFQ